MTTALSGDLTALASADDDALRRAYEAERAELVRRRVPGAAAFFAVSIGGSALIDRLVHPERADAVGVVFGSQLALAAAAVLVCRSRRITLHVEAVAAAFTVALALLANLYLVLVGAPLEHCTVTAVCFLAGGAVLLPWSWRTQLVVSLTLLLAFLVVAPLVPSVVGHLAMTLPVVVIATLMVMATLLLDRYRLEAFRRSSTEREQARVSAALARIGETLHAHLRDPAMLEHSNRLALELLGCDWSAIHLWDAEREAFSLRSLAIRPGLRLEASRREELEAAVFRRDALPLVRALETGRPICVEDDTSQPFVPAGTMRRFGFSSALFTPVVDAGTVIGVLAHGYERRTGPFSRAQRRIANGIAHVTAIAIDNARLIDQLTAVSRLKSEFVATMSHELRTPLNVITGYTDLLAEDAFGPLAHEQRDAVARVKQGALVLLGLVDTTLALGRLESGREPLAADAFSMRELLGELRREQEALAAPGVTVSWEAPAALSVVTDRGKVKTILANLVGNALKFTTEGRIAVRARWSHRALVVTVSDTGVGIAPEHLPIVFEMFRQVDGSPTRRFGGVGLGLHIVRRLTELLGGTVDVASEPGAGTTFTLRLPCERADDAPASLGP